jgi:hypothetical protein
MLILKYNKIKSKIFNSKFNLNFYKKYLSSKLLASQQIYTDTTYLKNISNKLIDKKQKINLIRFYNRKEKVPLRIMRYYSYFNKELVLKLHLSNWIVFKFAVYNGRKYKSINIYKGSLDKILKCKFKIGDFIFTRAMHIYRNKKK